MHVNLGASDAWIRLLGLAPAILVLVILFCFARNAQRRLNRRQGSK